MGELYAVFEDADKIGTTNKTAEMIKYTANSLLATMISFSNEIANLCSSLGDIDVKKVMQGVHLDHRLSPIMKDGSRVVPSITTYLEAGCGFGGSCFPKDVKALISHGEASGHTMELLESVIRINRAQPLRVLDLLHKSFDSLSGRHVTVLGLAFKPGTDDMRESPAIPIIRALHEEGAEIAAFDPIAMHEARKALDGVPVRYEDSMSDSVAGAEAVVLVTAWDAFRNLPELINSMDTPPVVIDGRRMIEKTAVPHYFGIGLSESHQVNGT
jgi:UDPglucose 6-dehydrogenase/GDP-mannose 6-dehydrogenase